MFNPLRIKRFTEFGIVDKLIKITIRKMPNPMRYLKLHISTMTTNQILKEKKPDLDQLNLNQLYFLFLLWFIGMLFSFLTFIIEFLYLLKNLYSQ